MTRGREPNWYARSRRISPAGGNVTKTKDALHVHVNTVTQRLERVSQVLGEDWQLGQRALEIRIAVYLQRIGAERWAT